MKLENIRYRSGANNSKGEFPLFFYQKQEGDHGTRGEQQVEGVHKEAKALHAQDSKDMSPHRNITLQDAAAHLHLRYLNQKIKDTCGYSFTRQRSFSKIINACALPHFEDLSISYISDLLSYSSTAAFYRQFQS